MSFEFSPFKLVYGGGALGHHSGRPVLASRVLPGERVEVEEVRKTKGLVHTRTLRILQPSPERIDPPCPYFGGCGGCHYQHFSPERQAAAKHEILRETLRRLGKIAWESEIPIHSGPAWNYRNQAQLKVARASPDGRAAVGFFEPESHRVFPVDACLILSPRLNAVLSVLGSEPWASRLARPPTGGEIELLADDRDEKVMVTLRGLWSPTEGEALARDCLAGLPGVVGVALGTETPLTPALSLGERESVSRRTGKEARRNRTDWSRTRGERHFRIFGEPAVFYRVGEFQYQISPGSFFQTSRFLLPELLARVTTAEPCPGWSGAKSGGVAMDLFAGVGLFSLPLAKRFAQVVSVEANAHAAADLAANAQAHGLKNLRLVADSVFDFLRRCAQPEPDLVVLDPPRAGVGINVLKLLLALRPKRLHYVSCSPPTLARDLQFLLGHGYRLDSIELFDFFPQTFHIETLAKTHATDATPA